MDEKKFIQNFADQFEETEVSVFTPDLNFRDLDEWSSLVALSVMAMINEEYDVCISAEEMVNANTIQELFNTVQSHL